MLKFKLDTVVKILEGAPVPIPAGTVGYVAYYYDKRTNEPLTEEEGANEDYVEFHELRLDNHLGGMGSVPVRYLEEETSKFWLALKKKHDDYVDERMAEIINNSMNEIDRHEKIVSILADKHDISKDLMAKILLEYDEMRDEFRLT